MEALALWLPSLIISLVAGGSFLYLAYQSRTRIDTLKHKLRQSSRRQVEHFLEREKRNTQQRIEQVAGAATTTPPAAAARWLPELRRCWLDAELSALVEHGQGNSSFELLQHNVAPLLRLIQRQIAPDAKKSWNGEETRQYLRKTHDAAASQKQFIAEFKAKVAGMGKESKAKSAEPDQAGSDRASGFNRSMEHMESSTHELMQTIERLERELAAAQGKYDIIKGKLDALEAIRATRDASVQLAERLSTAAATAPADRADNELLNDMEAAYSNSIAEMKKMSDINRQQRHLILQMEKELLLLRKGSVEQHAATEVLDRLKLQLRDYENCTTILEMESDTLREQISNLRRSIDASGMPIDIEPVAAPASPVAAPQNDKTHRVSLELLESIAQAESLEVAATRIVGWLERQSLASVVFLKGNREQVWMASEGRVDDHSRQLLKSIVPVIGKPISEVREGVLFTYSICRILLYGKGEFHERGSQAQLQLSDSFAAVDPIIQLLQDRIELRQQHRQMERIQQKIQGLLVQYNYIDGEYTRTEADFRKELKEYLATSATTEVQRQCIDTMLEDFDSQLEILSRTGKLIGNGLKASIQELSRVDHVPAG